jgi:hypothetical protein
LPGQAENIGMILENFYSCYWFAKPQHAPERTVGRARSICYHYLPCRNSLKDSRWTVVDTIVEVTREGFLLKQSNRLLRRTFLTLYSKLQ